MTTLTRLLTKLAKEFETSRRPERYFDVPKRGELSPYQVRKVRKRFKEIVERERCVETDSSDPSCYDRTDSDLRAKKKRKSSYKKDYDEVYHGDFETAEVQEDFITLLEDFGNEHPKGLLKIAAVTGLPIEPLREVYDIGVGAYATSGSRQGMSAEQWGYGRVYAFIMSYFHNEDEKYSRRRFLKNKTDEWIYEWIIDILEEPSL